MYVEIDAFFQKLVNKMPAYRGKSKKLSNCRDQNWAFHYGFGFFYLNLNLNIYVDALAVCLSVCCEMKYRRQFWLSVVEQHIQAQPPNWMSVREWIPRGNWVSAGVGSPTHFRLQGYLGCALHMCDIDYKLQLQVALFSSLKEMLTHC